MKNEERRRSLFKRGIKSRNESINREHLIDHIAKRLKLDYISDLHFLDNTQRSRLLVVLENSRDYPEKEWIDACEYIAGQKCFSGKEAKEILSQYAGCEKGHRFHKIIVPRIQVNLGKVAVGS